LYVKKLNKNVKTLIDLWENIKSPNVCSIRSLKNKAGAQKYLKSWAPWLMSVILATQEAETRRIEFQSQPGQIDFISKNPSQK
jgi:hypothetical protein